MKIGLSHLFVFGTIAASFSGLVHAEDSAGSDVKVLTQKNFDEWKENTDLGLVKFYAPWCGHCKQLAPEYEEAATELKDEGISLAKVDCTTETDLCEKYEIGGFPTLKVFKSGSSSNYNGSRKADGIKKYMKKQTQPAVTIIKVTEIEEFKEKDDIVIVGFATQGSKEFEEFEKVANDLRDDYTFAVVEPKDGKKNKKADFLLFKNFDDRLDTYKGELVADNIRKFIQSAAVPVLGEINQSTYPTYAKAGLPFAFVFYDTEESRDKLHKELYDVAKSFKGKLSFTLLDARKFPAHAEQVNLKQEWPAFGIQNMEEGTKYPFPQDKKITTKAIKKFVTKFVDGDLKPSIKSEPIPETNDEPVKVVVADSFKDVVFDKEKDVLLELYAPWCGYCKRLAPTYEKLAKVLENNKNLVIAKIDATANDMPAGSKDFQIQGFPTIKLIKAGDNSVVEYTGDRSLGSLVEFLEENVENSITYNKDDLNENDEEEEEKKEEKKEDEVDSDDEVEDVDEDDGDDEEEDQKEEEKDDTPVHEEL
ncbi:protein disulfide-isomerase precursor [Mycoemilia scoparia]|uniref:Protein disulfide-isomerase n=1 Tax=Mycoemilia scoparia TaxID=417184 RepID=A0A9W7ZXF6_9FUNG|nr:protein disulfide-isomerase precursor [Mycoemilia scoparia]